MLEERPKQSIRPLDEQHIATGDSEDRTCTYPSTSNFSDSALGNPRLQPLKQHHDALGPRHAAQHHLLQLALRGATPWSDTPDRSAGAPASGKGSQEGPAQQISRRHAVADAMALIGA